MQIGLGTLRLAPRDFWQMTPRELTCVLHGTALDPMSPMTRNNLVQLRERYPD